MASLSSTQFKDDPEQEDSADEANHNDGNDNDDEDEIKPDHEHFMNQDHISVTDESNEAGDDEARTERKPEGLKTKKTKPKRQPYRPLSRSMSLTELVLMDIADNNFPFKLQDSDKIP
jgi:hypothetical protein